MATGSALKLYTHRCRACRSPWFSTFRLTACIFCGCDVVQTKRVNGK